VLFLYWDLFYDIGPTKPAKSSPPKPNKPGDMEQLKKEMEILKKQIKTYEDQIEKHRREKENYREVIQQQEDMIQVWYKP
jgi:hypothetical protein